MDGVGNAGTAEHELLFPERAPGSTIAETPPEHDACQGNFPNVRTNIGATDVSVSGCEMVILLPGLFTHPFLGHPP